MDFLMLKFLDTLVKHYRIDATYSVKTIDGVRTFVLTVKDLPGELDVEFVKLTYSVFRTKEHVCKGEKLQKIIEDKRKVFRPYEEDGHSFLESYMTINNYAKKIVAIDGAIRRYYDSAGAYNTIVSNRV